MQRGPKKKSPEAKKATGTFRPSRDNPKFLVTDASPPKLPAYLSPEAQQVWREEFNRVVQAGTIDADSSLFARYCALESLARQAFLKGEFPKATYIVELRKLGEALGIGGVPSRAQRGTTAEPNRSNPFADLAGG
ncbi:MULTISPECIES: hypothetical protein [unclassified Sphingobium]|uniref:hypothetical protein n=1 Tax=unclassified Sphingobium TaxID=2611147 RepID=UPI002224E296|nr:MULTISPECIES: hypothetical protein [unclassified Sphingobium]MCW2412925.1 hypothetical protein [Sphingobium sp. B8D3D]MCW2414777.1 hypothetical protein [Sphingobium sp. B8D3A]